VEAFAGAISVVACEPSQEGLTRRPDEAALSHRGHDGLVKQLASADAHHEQDQVEHNSAPLPLRPLPLTLPTIRTMLHGDRCNKDWLTDA
jgi:hypothetical protein